MKKFLIVLIVLAILACGCNLNGLAGTTPNMQLPTGPMPVLPTGPIPVVPTNPTPTNPTPTIPAPTNPPAPSDPPTVKPEQCTNHKDGNNDSYCDDCQTLLLVYLDFFSINDLHGKLADGDGHPGVDELTTYLKQAKSANKNTILLSAGDMWQGQAESNMTKGNIITDWMNELDFTSMTIGNHEYDWGSAFIRQNKEIAEFPFLAINIYDRTTNQRVDYCDASTVVDLGNVQIGIIGAIGNHYSSIAVDKCADVYFKTGSALTTLVKEESNRLRNQGIDFVVYAIHGASSDYDNALSSGGYVDLVFEGHTHRGYTEKDSYGVYHLQNKGDNQDGISHAQIAINYVTNKFTVLEAGQISKSQYQSCSDDPIVNELLEKYDDILSEAYEVLGFNRAYRSSTNLGSIVAELYYKAGVEKWGDKYDIVLGGGSLNTRSPYSLPVGNVTYADLQSLFTFDNDIMLCSIKGSYLQSRFLENGEYRIGYGDYGQSVFGNIDPNATYYVVVDSWSAYYSPNHLTVVEQYGPGIYARDLLADYIRQGGLA